MNRLESQSESKPAFPSPLEAPLVVPLVAATDPRLCGHKAAALAALAAGGAEIPSGFVVTAAGCARGDEEALRRAVSQALEELPGPVAVRSSAAAEDLSEASFAGQYESFLDVAGIDGVMGALRRCIASASGERVTHYAGEHGIELAGAPFAVLVQSMVPAEVSGIALSSDPRTGDDRVVISATRGLGDRLAAGEVSGDEWVVEGEASRPEARALAVVEGSLDAADALRVAALARWVARERGAPQDIEWALAGGELYLLQARPITALPVRPELELPTEGTWLKDTVHYPDLMTPFGADIYLPGVAGSLDPVIAEFGLLLDGFQSISLGGEIYNRPLPPGGKEGPAPPWWLLGLLARVLPSMRARCRAAEGAVATGKLESLPAQWESEWRPSLEEAIRRHLDVDLGALSDDQLLAELDALVGLLHRGGVLHMRLFIPYVVALYELVQGARKLLGWETGKTLELLSGLSVASSGPARALDDLGARVAASPAALQALRVGDPERLREVAPEVADAFESYGDTWGWRPLNYDPGCLALAERPGLIASQVLDRLEAGARAPDLAGAREARVAEARAALGESAERVRFERLLAAAQRVYPQREDNVRLTDNLPCGLIRRWLLEAGRRLRERGLLHAPEDAAWLREAEVREALAGNPAPEMARLPERRRAEQAWVRAHPGPEVIGPPPSAPPDLRGLPTAARRINEAMMWIIGEELEPPEGDPQAAEAGHLVGLPVCGGRYEGPARVIRGEADFERLRAGDVLVCTITTPSWSPLFALAGAVVTDAGSLLSHTAIVAREHGIPTVVATGSATRALRDGQRVRVDGSAGVVLPLASA